VSSTPRYDSISKGYASARREDPHIAVAFQEALGGAERIVNFGAGTGNYEPRDRTVVAVELSSAMIAQRLPGAAPVIRAAAEATPIMSGWADAAMASLTIHHWTNLDAGLCEMARVAPRQVIFLFDHARTGEFWALEYFPESLAVDSERLAPDPARVAAVLDVRDVRVVPVPIDCTDGFGAAYYGRPEAYLDSGVQEGMSWLALLPPAARARGEARLAEDLRSGRWDARYGHLRHEPSHDFGYRLVIAGDA
jgi:SAM-dependent methyltransferase